MQREEFLKQLVLLYPTSFNENNLQIWMSGYKEVLSENINYDKLLTIMMSENQYNSAPKPAWLKERATYKKHLKDNGVTLLKLLYKNEEVDTEYEFWYNPERQTKYQARESIEREYDVLKRGYKFIEEVPTTNVF